ncbi:hypothetical protein AC1031_001265 [Aphanomyces cochlioides]|nr:hypothetical protein AC1031_001265 [Aphanomyces cochlioides]
MEREVDHVRVLNRGILEFFPPVGVDEQADASRAKSLDVTNPQIVAHSSLYGVTILSTPQGLAIARFQTLEEATNTSVEKGDSNLDPLIAMPVDVVVDLPTSPYLLSLSPSQKLLAIAFDSSLAIFEVARLVDPQATKKPICLCNGADALSLSWCKQLNGNGDDQWIAVLTTSRQIHVYNMQGNLECLEGSIEATSHCWSPTESILAVGDDEGVIHKLQYLDTSFTEVGTLVNSENSDNAPVHHINWAEEDLLFAGYRIGDIDDVQVTACVFDNGTEVALDTVVDFFPSETREHTFYSCYLEPWRMFFVGCSLSTDIELLVSDPETNEWQKWKPEEKYTPRLPMTSDDNDTYPVGMALVLNSTTDILGDNCQFYPCPLVLCATTDGKLLNFALLDISVGEPLDFLAAPSDIGAPSRPTVDAPWTTPNGNKAQEEQRVVFGVSTTAPSFSFESKDDSYGKGSDNVFADDDDEDDEDEEEERKEEEEKAMAAFDAVDKKGKGTIPLTDFEKLFEALGTVCSAEEHTRTIHKLDRKGVIRKEDFVAWYLQWIFADFEDDNEDDDDANAGAKNIDPNAPIKSEAEIKAAFAKFAPPSGSWKCEVCMIMNPTAGAPKCISCDSPNPNATKSAPAPAAAGFGAFVAPPGSFKGLAVSSTDKPTGFGAPTSAPSGAQAFSFGVPSEPPASTPSSLSFGVPSQSASSAPSSFSFGVSAQSTPSTPEAFSFGVKSEPAMTEKTSNKEYGSDTNNVYVEDDDDDSDDEEDRKEEEEKVSAAFDKVDSSCSGKIPVADFEKLFEALGTVYSADEHTRTLKKLERAGYVHKSDFVTWYITWIFAEENESDEEEDATSVPDVDPSATMKSEAERKAAFAKFQAPTGSWKCETCMIMNTDPKAAKCASCETPNPNAPKETKSATSLSASPFGAGGFTPFGVSTEKKAFGFGVTSTPDEKTTTPSASPSTAQPTFSFGVPSDNKPPTFSFGVKTEEKVNEKSDYGKDTDNVFNDEDGSDDDEIDEEERKEEEEKASNAFDQVDTEATGKIPSSKFENIFDALGTVYSADEHTRTTKKLDKNGYIFKKDFVVWYLNWIFADDDGEDDEEETSAAPDFDPNAAKKSADEIKNAWKKFEAPPGSWKCSVCMIVNNDENASRCVSCESPNPNAKSEVKSEETEPLSFGSGGFKFGVTEAAPSNGFGVKQAESNTNSFSSISLGAGNSISLTGSKGFTFPMPTSASKTSSDSTADAKPATSNAPAAKPAFSFGATSTLKAATSYPPDTSTKHPVTFGATTAKPASPAYPPDTSTKPAVAFGATAAKPASSAYPPDTSTKPAVAFGATAAKTTSSAYPPDTSTKPAVAFGATAAKPASSAYPPDTSTKPAVAFGATAAKTTSSAYPPDTSTKPAVAFGATAAKPASSAYPPDTSTKPAVAFGATAAKTTSSAYPPDTSTKPAVAFGATAAKPASSAYPPDTSTKPAVAFGATAAKTTSSAYPPDTSTKPAVAFGATAAKPASSAYPPDTSTKLAVTFGFTGAKSTSSAYPPDTSTKHAVAFGATAAKPASSAYPPDTSTKPAVAFGFTPAKTATSAYPPDTSTKPAVAFGATTTKSASSAYPPDTSTKPPIAFGAPKPASSAYPPDTSTKPAVAFGATTAMPASSAYPPDTRTKPAVAFGATAFKPTSSAYPPDTSTKPAVAFDATAAKPTSSASPPDTSSKAPVAFGFGSSSTPSFSFGAKTTPSLSTDTSNKSVGGFGTTTPKVASSTPSQEAGSKPPTSFTPAPALDTSKNTLKFGGSQSKTPAAFSTGAVSSTQGTKLPTGTVQLQKALPASAFEGEMWKLINGFDQSFQKIRQKDDTFIAQKNQQEAPFVATLKELRSEVLNMCEVVDKLNDSYEKIEKDTQVIMGYASDVDAQSKCSDNLLKAMNDKNLVAQLEDEPLDQRSQNKREALRSQLETIERYSVDLEKHVASLKRPGQAQSASSMNDTTHLFRILKMNYETSKREYNRVLELEDQFKRLEMKTQLQSRIQKTSTPIPTKELLKQLRHNEQSQRTLKSNLLKWTSEPIKPRVIANAVRRRPLRETISELRPAPEVPARVASKLMFGANTTIPSQATESGNLSFQPVPTKPKPLAKVAASTENETTKSVSFAPSTKPAALNFAKSTTLKSMPSLDSLSFGKKREKSVSDEPEEKTDSPRARKLSTGSKSGTPERPTGFKLSTPTVPTVKPLDFGAKPKETPKEMPSFSFSVSAKPTEKQPSPFSTPAPAATPAINYVERLKAFYAAYAPGKSTEAAEKLLEKHKGKEEEVFQKLLVKYISDKATLEHVKEFLKTGRVPESLKNLAKPADTSAATTTAPPAFGAKPPTAPVAASPSPFGTAAVSTTTTTASPFGSATTASSPFGSTAATQATPATAAASPFGSTSAWPSTPASQPAASPFGSGSTSSFGVDYRSKVVEFYKKHNPDKLAEVDTVLQKYKGKEEELLRKLEAKYNKPQATGFGSASPFGAPANSGFGAAASPFGSTTQQPAKAGFGAAASPFTTPAQAAPSTPSFGSQAQASPFGASSSGFASASPFGAASTPAAPAFGTTTSLGGNSPFGAPSATPAFGSTTPMGAASSTPAFGATTALGGSASPAFGSTTALGGTATPAFGSASQLGGGFGSSAPAFGAPSALGAAAPAAGGGFSAFATSSTPSFGFGGQASGGGFGGQATSGGGGFGSGFGQTSAFTSSSFTQARR